MATTRRSRSIAAAPGAVWEIVRDLRGHPRWWPGVRRVEGVDDDRFTQVLYTAGGRAVRIDLTLIADEPGQVLAWTQELAGTPFERHLAEAVTEIRLEPDTRGTLVTIEQRARLRGTSRAGGWMLRRSARRRLGEALERLEALLAAPSS
jgi:uncharacterized protein YndB with AHSA1/START domain